MAHLLTFAMSVREFISLPLFPQLNVVYRDEIVIDRLHHGWGEGRGLPILVMPLGIAPRTPDFVSIYFLCYLIQVC